jgi:hypothetical protein
MYCAEEAFPVGEAIIQVSRLDVEDIMITF